MKYMSVIMGGILKILSLSEILPVYLVDTLYPSVLVMADKYCIVGRVHGATEN